MKKIIKAEKTLKFSRPFKIPIPILFEKSTRTKKFRHKFPNVIQPTKINRDEERLRCQVLFSYFFDPTLF